MTPSASPSAPLAPDPGRIVAMMTAFEQTAALNAAIRVGLFTAVAHGAHDADLLAKRCGCAPRAARILADVLTVHGLLTKQEGRYALAADTALFLDARSPSYIGEAARFLASPEKIDLYFTNPEGWARRGGPAGLANVTPESPVWVDFARGMANFMAPVATGVAEMLQARLAPAPSRILDIAAGHGLFGISCLKVFPGSEVMAVDWAPVLAVAADTAANAGIEARWTALPGSAFDLEARCAYDLVLVPNFLHHFDPPTCVTFLRRVGETLKPGGAVAIVEYTPDESRVSPPGAALFALSMLTGTPAGDAYTAQELGAMCIEAGLPSLVVEPIPGTAQTLLIAQRAGES